MNQPRNNFGQVAEAIEDELSRMALSLVRRKPQAEKEPTRVNLMLVGGAAFLMLTLLDIISGVVTGMLTNFLYGLLVVAIGVGALAVAEIGYFWAYSSKWQKIVCVVDGALGILSTLLVGISAGVLYALDAFAITDTSGWKVGIELGMMAYLVFVGASHSILWISFVLIDKGVQMVQSYQQGKASNKMRNQLLSLSEENMATSLNMASRLLQHTRNNKGGLLREEIKNLSGEDLLADMESVTVDRSNGNHPS